jgi:maltooligosyltrehalose trehalohydrolase
MRRAHAMRFGAEIRPGGGVRFRLWAPDVDAVSLLLEGSGAPRSLAMEPLADGWFERVVPDAGPGTRYRFDVDGGPPVPDPASRWQPDGVHGASAVVDPGAYAWRDADWRGRPWEETVLYELHVGAATAGGGALDVIPLLDPLARLGVTAIELMPPAQAPGTRGWGYDGVYPFAPNRALGPPEALKRLVDEAHACGLMVFVDVVYNHFGPEGNHLARYASPFFTERHQTPWGAALDFEGPRSGPVRAFFIENALYWLEEFHADGLRLDAVHAIHDASRPDLIEELAATVWSRIAGRRAVHLVLEYDANEAHRLARAHGRPVHYTGQWNDDLHHALHVLLTGERDGYYEDYAGDPHRHLGRALAEGFAWQGEPSPHRKGAPRGEPSAALPPTAFVGFLQNHDQVGNRAFGERLAALADREALRAARAVLLLAPHVPLLFFGEEWDAPEPFPFFGDFEPELAEAVRAGRRREFAAFPAFRDPAALDRLPDPCDPATFRAAQVDRTRAKVPPHADTLEWHRQLLALRHREIVPRLRGAPGGSGTWRRLGASAIEVAWTLGDGSRLVLRTNLDAGACRFTPWAQADRLLLETPAGAAAQAAAGRLPAWSACWWLAPA